ncbi:MAG: sodium:solute symporter family protein [Syntrophaceticus sp.]
MLSGATVWSIIIVYMALLLLLGIYSWWKEKSTSTQEYFTAGGSIKWFILVMTYIASLMSTWVFFAGPGGYYRGGLTFWISELSYIPLFPVITYFVMNKVWLLNSQRHYSTPADIYDDRFRSPVLRAVLSIIFFAVSLPYVASVFIACARGAEIASGGTVSYSAVIVVVGLVTLLFVSVGGMKSIAWADTIQGWLFVLGLWAIAIYALKSGFGGSLTAAVDSVWKSTNAWFSYPGPDNWVPYAARLGYPLSCAIGWTVMLPHVFIRAGYSGDSLSSQRKLMTLAPILQALVWTGTMLIGLIAIGLVPGLSGTDTELIIPYLINNIILPHGAGVATVLMGLFILGALAVGLSTANGFLLVSGSIVSEDFIKKLLKIKVSPKQQMLIARFVVIILGLASMWLALNPPQLIWTLIMFAIAMVMPIFPILVCALYWRRATAPAAVTASIAGVITVLLTYQFGLGDTWYGAFGMLVSTVLMIVVSYLTKETDKQVLDEFYGALETAEAQYYVN